MATEEPVTRRRGRGRRACSSIRRVPGKLLEALPSRVLDGEKRLPVGRDGAGGGDPADHLAVEPGQPGRFEAVINERLPDERKERPDDLLGDRRGVVADLELGVGVHPQGEEVEEIVEIDLPVGLGVGRERKILTSLLTGDARLEPLLVDAPGKALELGLRLREAMAGGGREASLRALAIRARLGAATRRCGLPASSRWRGSNASNTR